MSRDVAKDRDRGTLFVSCETAEDMLTNPGRPGEILRGMVRAGTAQILYLPVPWYANAQTHHRWAEEWREKVRRFGGDPEALQLQCMTIARQSPRSVVEVMQVALADLMEGNC